MCCYCHFNKSEIIIIFFQTLLPFKNTSKTGKFEPEPHKILWKSILIFLHTYCYQNYKFNNFELFIAHFVLETMKALLARKQSPKVFWIEVCQQDNPDYSTSFYRTSIQENEPDGPQTTVFITWMPPSYCDFNNRRPSRRSAKLF